MVGRPSIAQIEALVEFLEQNPGIAKGQLRTTHAKQLTKRKWALLATTINTLGPASKSGAEWAKYWAEKKCALKKTCSVQAASMRRTGGGMDNLPTLSPLDLRLVEVMGVRGFAEQDSELAVEPFPQPAGSPASPESETEWKDVRIYQPSTSSNATTPQPQPILTDLTQSQSQPLQSPRRGILHRSPRRPRRVRPPTVSNIMNRMARLEESRVAAETMTAQAFADTSVRLDRCAGALEQLAAAVREAGTTIANAILVMAQNNQ